MKVSQLIDALRESGTGQTKLDSLSAFLASDAGKSVKSAEGLVKVMSHIDGVSAVTIRKAERIVNSKAEAK